MDREAWCAAVHRVAKSWTWLSNWTELNCTFQDQKNITEGLYSLGNGKDVDDIIQESDFVYSYLTILITKYWVNKLLLTVKSTKILKLLTSIIYCIIYSEIQYFLSLDSEWPTSLFSLKDKKSTENFESNFKWKWNQLVKNHLFGIKNSLTLWV